MDPPLRHDDVVAIMPLMALPESGDDVFPGGLSPLAVDRDPDRCTY